MYSFSDRWLRLTLSDPADANRELNVDFRIYDTPIAQRWSDVIVVLRESNASINDPERFYNFPNDPKVTAEWIREELQRCVDGVNRWHPGFIDIALKPELDQAQMNLLHEYFVNGVRDLQNLEGRRLLSAREPLAVVRPLVKDLERWERFCAAFLQYTGRHAEALGFDEIIALFTGHPEFGYYVQSLGYSLEPAIPHLLRLNVAIHRWEDRGAAVAHETQFGKAWKYYVMSFFPLKRRPMLDEDYQHFTIRDVFGEVYIDDVSEGKCIWDVYRDGDTELTDEHYKSLGKYWGNARFYFGPTHSEALSRQRLAEFWTWFDANELSLNKLGFHRDDPKMMTLGAVPVAKIDPRDALAGLDEDAIVDAISRHQYMKRFAIIDDHGRVIHSSRRHKGEAEAERTER